MSLLNLRKKNTPNITAAKGGVLAQTPVTENKIEAHAHALSDILVRPHITEKSATTAERGSYVFEVAVSATKRDIALAVHRLFKVTPVKVTTVTMPRRRIMVKGRPGFRKGRKKAYVYLKKGEKIELV